MHSGSGCIRACLAQFSKCCMRHATALMTLNLTRWTTPSKAEPQMTPAILEEWEAFRRPKGQDSWLILLCVPWVSILAFLFHYSSNGGAGILESANNFPQLLPVPFPALSFILKGLRTQNGQVQTLWPSLWKVVASWHKHVDLTGWWHTTKNGKDWQGLPSSRLNSEYWVIKHTALVHTCNFTNRESKQTQKKIQHIIPVAHRPNFK